jgi:hypothetical protein
MRLAALALLAGLIAQAEQTARQPPVFRARTELVQVDVVVVDADGHVVQGLTERDFQIFDRGRSQRVAAPQRLHLDCGWPQCAGFVGRCLRDQRGQLSVLRRARRPARSAPEVERHGVFH